MSIRIEQVVEWLQNELLHNREVDEGKEELTDGTHDIVIGRSECADELLNFIKSHQ